MKYLHRFQWCHLSERLAHEQTVYHQRMRTEISQAKKETNFYLASVEKSQRLESLRKKKEKKGEVIEETTWDYKQHPTEEEIHLKRFKNKGLSKKNLQKAQEKSKTIHDKAQSNVSLLAKIFSRGKAREWFSENKFWWIINCSEIFFCICMSAVQYTIFKQMLYLYYVFDRQDINPI